MNTVTAKDIEAWIAQRGCTIVEDAGEFALVHPAGYGGSLAAHTLAAKDRDSALAESWRFLNPEAHAHAQISTIKRVVAESYGTVPTAFLKQDRSEPIATARRIAMALCRDLTAASRETIAKAFDRERQAVRHAVLSVAAECETDKQFAARVGTLRQVALAAFVVRPPEKKP